MEIYRPGQVEILYPYILDTPKWFLLGGPSHSNEAQCIVKKYPGINVLAFEPDPNMFNWQMNNGFPTVGKPTRALLPFALWSACDKVILTVSEPGHSSLLWDRNGELLAARGVTLDSVNVLYGPIENAILWLDIEGAELEALKGAEKLFEAGAIDLVNVEVCSRNDAELKISADIDFWLGRRGFSLAHTWNEQVTHRDRIYTRS